jgi:cobalamin biosynthesis protein CobD/CbiB
MAAVAGVTPAQLEQAGRADAAAALAAAPGTDAGDAILRRVREMSTDQARELLAAIAVQLGVTLGGEGAAEPESRYGT